MLHAGCFKGRAASAVMCCSMGQERLKSTLPCLVLRHRQTLCRIKVRKIGKAMKIQASKALLKSPSCMFCHITELSPFWKILFFELHIFLQYKLLHFFVYTIDYSLCFSFLFRLCVCVSHSFAYSAGLLKDCKPTVTYWAFLKRFLSLVCCLWWKCVTDLRCIRLMWSDVNWGGDLGASTHKWVTHPHTHTHKLIIHSQMFSFGMRCDPGMEGLGRQWQRSPGFDCLSTVQREQHVNRGKQLRNEK